MIFELDQSRLTTCYDYVLRARPEEEINDKSNTCHCFGLAHSEDVHSQDRYIPPEGN